jgi:hypothetical protein
MPTERPPLVGEISANFADRGCCVVSTTDPYGRIFGLLLPQPFKKFRNFVFAAEDLVLSGRCRGSNVTNELSNKRWTDHVSGVENRIINIVVDSTKR